jgi:hypothetical protein
LLSTAKDEPEEPADELEDPVELLGDEALPVAPVEELLLEELLALDALVVPVAETVSPTSPESETIVPSCGAYSLVF